MIFNELLMVKNLINLFENMVNVGVSDGMGMVVVMVEVKKVDEMIAVFTFDKASSCVSFGELKLLDLYLVFSVIDLCELVFEIVCLV